MIKLHTVYLWQQSDAMGLQAVVAVPGALWIEVVAVLFGLMVVLVVVVVGKKEVQVVGKEEVQVVGEEPQEH